MIFSLGTTRELKKLDQGDSDARTILISVAFDPPGWAAWRSGHVSAAPRRLS